MKLLALALLLSPLSALASLDACEPLEATRNNTMEVNEASSCRKPEMEAALVALRNGLDDDISRLVVNQITSGLEDNGKTFTASCKRSNTQAVRTQVENGNHGKVISILLLTEVTCKGKYFISSPLHRFPILVKLWANHDETEVDANPANYLEVKKLYEPET